jgi:glycosyltransferase involved in cell wall biosynthesis
MALHALRRRLRPRTRIKQVASAISLFSKRHSEKLGGGLGKWFNPRARAKAAIFRVAHFAHRNPEIKRYLVRAVSFMPKVEARLRNLVTPPGVTVASYGLPRPDGQFPRVLGTLHAKLKLARDTRRRGIVWGPGLVTVSGRERPRLAFVSPVPPDRSGIADYSATLLPALAEHYDITLIHPTPLTVDPWLLTRFAVRDSAWFMQNGYAFDRVLYQFGNSSFHMEMLDLLVMIPGVVMQHDFYLSGLRLWRTATGANPPDWYNALERSHGTAALGVTAQIGNDAARERYPCNKDVIENALGMLTHSLLGKRLAEQWYGLDTADRFIQVPFALKVAKDTEPETRAATRAAFGLKENDFVVCTFGHIASTKLNAELLDAWITSGLVDDPQAHLVFVGQPDGPYGETLIERIEALTPNTRVRITGYASHEDYAAWLMAADMGVQLRTQSRGETSASVFDCMAHGLPTVVNAHGWAAELPAEVVIRIEDTFTPASLAEALHHYRTHPELARAKGRAGQDFVRTWHTPEVSARGYRDAIEQHYIRPSSATHREILACVDAVPNATDDDLLALTYSMVHDQVTLDAPQWMIDVTTLMNGTAPPETLATFNKLLDDLLRNSPAGWRITPVYFDTAYYRYARRDMLERLGLPNEAHLDELVTVRGGDRFLGLGLAQVEHEHATRTFSSWQRQGVSLFWMIADVEPWPPVPQPEPEPVPEGAEPVRVFTFVDLQLRYIVQLADRMLAPTEATAVIVVNKMDALGIPRAGTLAVDICPIDADAITRRLAEPASYLVWDRYAAEFLPELLPA